MPKDIERRKMNLTQHYEELYKTSIRKIQEDDYQLDPLIDSSEDKRFGISLRIRPPENITEEIQAFLEKLKQIDPFQYYYPSADIHITVMSIISCYQGFKLENIQVPEYLRLLRKSVQEFNKFEINFQGITASDSAIMVRGFPQCTSLDELRNNLRVNFKSSGVEQSLDRRYTIQTAHSTIVRFRKELQEKENFLKVMEECKNYDFGNFEVEELELVYNDWYQRKKNLILLATLKLQAPYR